MITIPTGELIGLVNDVLPFVDSDKDSPTTHCVRVEQVGDRLTTLATSRTMAARSTWSPDDGPVEIAGNFDIRISPAEAKAIVSTFKLPDKLSAAPLEISMVPGYMTSGLYRLRIFRPGLQDVYSALKMDVEGRGPSEPDNGDAPEIDINHRLDQCMVDSDPSRADARRIQSAAFSPLVFAALGKVQRHGILKLHWTSERDGSAVYVKAGPFDAMAYQAKVGPRAHDGVTLSGGDILRNGSGLLVAGE
jgi:hypothetical protein